MDMIIRALQNDIISVPLTLNNTFAPVCSVSISERLTCTNKQKNTKSIAYNTGAILHLTREKSHTIL